MLFRSFFDPDFTDMDPDPIEHGLANLSRERPQPSLDQQRELHGIRGFGKDDEERVAGVSISWPSLKWPKISLITAW